MSKASSKKLDPLETVGNYASSASNLVSSMDNLFGALSNSISGASSLFSSSDSSAGEAGGPQTVINATAVLDTSAALSSLSGLENALQISITTSTSWGGNMQAQTANTGNAFSTFTKSISQVSVSFLDTIASGVSYLKTAKDLEKLNMASSFTRTGGAVRGATGAMRLLGAATKSVPIFAMIGLVTSLCSVIGDWVSSSDEASQANKRLGESMNDMEKESALEQINLDRLFDSLKKAEEGSAEWMAIRDTINSKYSGYLDKMGIEINTAQDATDAYYQLSDSIKETARQRALEKVLATEAEAYVDKQLKQQAEMRETLSKKYSKEEVEIHLAQIQQSIATGQELPKESAEAARAVNKNIKAIKEAQQTYDTNTANITAIFDANAKAADFLKTQRQKNTTEPDTTQEGQGNQTTGKPKEEKGKPMLSPPATTSNTKPDALNNALTGQGNTAPAAGGGGGTIKNINVTIGNLIDKFEITAGNLQESTDRMREMVASVLIDAVNDLNTAI